MHDPEVDAFAFVLSEQIQGVGVVYICVFYVEIMAPFYWDKKILIGGIPLIKFFKTGETPSRMKI